MEDLSLHILDIGENSIEAGATRVEIRIKEDIKADRLTIEVSDNGKGMDSGVLCQVADPFFTTRKKKKSFGLGIPLLKQSAESCQGGLSIDSEPGRGTTLTSSFRLSHIDLKPMGDLAATMITLISGHPEIDYVLSYQKGDFSYTLDTGEIKKELGEVHINFSPVLKIIRDEITDAMWQKDMHENKGMENEESRRIRE